MTTPLQMPTVPNWIGSLTNGPGGSPSIWDAALQAGEIIPPGNALAFLAGWGALNVVINSLDDDSGNPWEVVTHTTNQRPNLFGLCREIRTQLLGPHWIWMRAESEPVGTTSVPGGGRAILARFNQPVMTVGTPVNNGGNNVSPSITVPALPGELILASWIHAGNIAISNLTWDVLQAVSNTPILRAVYKFATGTEALTASAATANAWAINAVRLAPAVPSRKPLKIYTATGWQGVKRA